MSEIYIGAWPANDYRYYLKHSAKGSTWEKKKHKYLKKIKKENGSYRYVYGAFESVTPESVEAEKVAGRRNALIEDYDNDIRDAETAIKTYDSKIADFERKAGREPQSYSVNSSRYRAYTEKKKKYENELRKAKKKRAALDTYNDDMIDALASKRKHYYESKYDKRLNEISSKESKQYTTLHRKPR